MPTVRASIARSVPSFAAPSTRRWRWSWSCIPARISPPGSPPHARPPRRLPGSQSAAAAPDTLPDSRPEILSEESVLEQARALDVTWRDAGGIWGWITTVDHKAIAKRYVVTAFLMFIAGGVEAAMMRMQLAR